MIDYIKILIEIEQQLKAINATLGRINNPIQESIPRNKDKADFIRKYAPELYVKEGIHVKSAVECAANLYEAIEQYIKENC